MNKKSKNILILLVVAIIIVGGVGFLLKNASKPGKYDSFAQCLKDKGSTFYGAFWCSHCQSQKKIFGKSARLLPYVECSTADGRSQLSICRDKNIDGYPLWEFADGSRQTGEVSLGQLAEKTGCELPK
jgi:hypothetical protein